MVLKIKNILFWSFVSIALIGGVYAYFAIKQSKKPQVEALTVIPDSCLVYLNTNDFFGLSNKIRSQSLIADKLKLFKDIDLVIQQLYKFDSVFNADERIKEEFDNNLIHLALYNTEPDWLMTLNIKQLGNQAAISDKLKDLLKAKEEELNSFSFTVNNQLIYFSLETGVICLSNKLSVLKKTLDKKTPRFYKSNSYNLFKATLSEDNQLGVYVNHGLYGGSSGTKKLNLAGLCKKGFSAGQIDLEPSGLSINGFMKPDSTELIAALGTQESQSPQEILLILPLNLTSFKSYGFGSYKNFISKLVKNPNQENNQLWTGANDTAMYNLKAEFEANIKNHLLMFETGITKQVYVAAQVQDTVKTIEQLGYLSDTAFSSSGTKIFRLKHYDEPQRLFAPVFNAKTSFACVFNSFLLLAETKADLESLLGNLSSEFLAIKNESFNYYRSQNFPDEYNYLYYTTPSGNRENNEEFFKFKTTADKDPYENLRHFSFSLINDAHAFKFRLNLFNEAESNARDENVLWTLNLDTVSTMKAASFINHTNGENEIIIQDELNKLYLINAKGNVVWTKKLDEKIQSEIYRVDIFKNNKFQMLFNTKNHIYLLDRNGNHVKGYPVDLPAEATSQISLLDYENDKDYRIFIACSDHSIYNYNAHGIAQEGFIPVQTENEVMLPIQFVKVGKSDYLIALDKEGKIYTFGRKGQARIGLKNRSLANCPAFYVDGTNNLSTTNLVCIDDKSGLINKISFADKKELIKLNMEHGSADINFQLVDDNRDMDVVITINGNIQAFNFNGELLTEKNTGLDLCRTSYYNDESHSVFYSLNSDKTEVIANDLPKQKTRKLKAAAMPLVCTLFNDSKKYLIITNGKQLSCVPAD